MIFNKFLDDQFWVKKYFDLPQYEPTKNENCRRCVWDKKKSQSGVAVVFLIFWFIRVRLRKKKERVSHFRMCKKRISQTIAFFKIFRFIQK